MTRVGKGGEEERGIIIGEDLFIFIFYFCYVRIHMISGILNVCKTCSVVSVSGELITKHRFPPPPAFFFLFFFFPLPLRIPLYTFSLAVSGPKVGGKKTPMMQYITVYYTTLIPFAGIRRTESKSLFFLLLLNPPQHLPPILFF